MKLITAEEEKAHYNAVITGGSIGGILGLGLGWAGSSLASRRYPAFRTLTIPFKAFLISSTGVFGAIIEADRWSMDFERRRDPNSAAFYKTEDQKMLDEHRDRMTADVRLLTMAREHRYKIVFGSWLASMVGVFVVLGRSKHMTGAQKIVQARVYAQALALAVIVATAALEVQDAKRGEGRWETVMVVDPEDPEHKRLIEKKIHKEDYQGQDLWKDMVAAEERRLATQKKGKADAGKAAH